MRKFTKKAIAVTLSAALVAGTFLTNTTIKAEDATTTEEITVTYPWTPVEGGTTGDYIADSYEGVETGHVFESVTQERLLDILASEGNYYILFGGPEHETTQTVLAAINEQAKADGITKIYHFDPYIDGYQIDITDENTPWKASSSVYDLWTRITAALPESSVISNYNSEDTLLFAYSNNGETKSITASYSFTKEKIDTTKEDIKSSVAKVFRIANGTVIPASERTDFDFFKRVYNGSASYIEQRQDRSANRLGTAVELFTEEDKEGFALHQVNFNELINILQSPGQHYIFFGASWCHNTQAIIGSVARKAKANGIETVYVYDTTVGNQLVFGDEKDPNKVTGSSSGFNSRNNASATKNNISYLYGELVKFLGNYQTENNSKKNNSITYYPNGDLSADITSVKPWEGAEEGVVTNAIRLQLPFLIGFDKDAEPKVNKQWLHANTSEGTEGTYTEYMLELAWVLATDEAKTSKSKYDGLSAVEFAADAVNELSSVLGDKEIGYQPPVEVPTEATTEAPSKEDSTTKAEDTSKKEKTTAEAKKLKKVTIKKATKKKSAKKLSVSLKKVSGAAGYQVQVLKTKKAKKALLTKKVKKISATITSKKLKNQKKLFVRARAYKKNGKKNTYGEWSAVKAVKIK